MATTTLTRTSFGLGAMAAAVVFPALRHSLSNFHFALASIVRAIIHEDLLPIQHIGGDELVAVQFRTTFLDDFFQIMENWGLGLTPARRLPSLALATKGP
jgi:hypothetical protein